MQTYIKNPKVANFLHYFRFTLTRAYVNVFFTKKHTSYTFYSLLYYPTNTYETGSRFYPTPICHLFELSYTINCIFGLFSQKTRTKNLHI